MLPSLENHVELAENHQRSLAKRSPKCQTRSVHITNEIARVHKQKQNQTSEKICTLEEKIHASKHKSRLILKHRYWPLILSPLPPRGTVFRRESFISTAVTMEGGMPKPTQLHLLTILYI